MSEPGRVWAAISARAGRPGVTASSVPRPGSPVPGSRGDPGTGGRPGGGAGAEVRQDLIDYRPLGDERHDPRRAVARRPEGVDLEDLLEEGCRRALGPPAGNAGATDALFHATIPLPTRYHSVTLRHTAGEVCPA